MDILETYFETRNAPPSYLEWLKTAPTEDLQLMLMYLYDAGSHSIVDDISCALSARMFAARDASPESATSPQTEDSGEAASKEPHSAKQDPELRQTPNTNETPNDRS